MRLSFLNKSHPVITGIMSGETPEDLIAQSKACETDGAHGIAINLSDLKPEFRNTGSLKTVIDSVELPFMFFFYRSEENSDEDARQEVLLDAVDAGASIIDVMGDLYDPSDMEITYDKDAIEKQKALIEEVHSRGADVVMSSHMSCSRTADQVLAHLQEAASRGPDVVKIVTMTNTREELAETLRTTMVLKQELDKPFIHLCNGPYSRLHRYIGPKLGVSIMFAVHDTGNSHGYTQPPITSVKKVLETIDWHINEA